MGILEGKAAVVTGGGRGIGRGHCLHLGAQGAAVIVNDLDLEVAQEVCDEITKAGGRAMPNTSDCSTREGAQAIIEQCCSDFGKIDAVVNNAGIARDKTLLKMTDDEFESVMQVHLGSTFRCGQEAARKMKEQGTGGAIVNTISGAAFGNFGQTNYSAAKGAIASMTLTWALELLRYGIRVNAIAPQGTTRMSATAKGDGGAAAMGDANAIDPTFNGPAVAYLCSDEASWVHGQLIGTGSNRLVVMNQLKYGTGMFTEPGTHFDVEKIQKQFQTSLAQHLEPYGLWKHPYNHVESPVESPAK
jgi:3-oxoacyl-[acyl-carrier protein] reductase